MPDSLWENSHALLGLIGLRLAADAITGIKTRKTCNMTESPTPPQEDTPPTPTVFISYSHDSSEHKVWVAALAQDLRKHGIDAILDQWHLRLVLEQA